MNDVDRINDAINNNKEINVISTGGLFLDELQGKTNFKHQTLAWMKSKYVNSRWLLVLVGSNDTAGWNAGPVIKGQIISFTGGIFNNNYFISNGVIDGKVNLDNSKLNIFDNGINISEGADPFPSSIHSNTLFSQFDVDNDHLVG